MENKKIDPRPDKRSELRRKRIMRNRIISVVILLALIFVLYSGLKALISSLSGDKGDTNLPSGNNMTEVVNGDSKNNGEDQAKKDSAPVYIKAEEKMDLNFEQKIEKYNDLPNSLKEKINKYPDTENTILSYDLASKEPGPIDISKDVEIAKKAVKRKYLPYFTQWDQRWGSAYVQGDYMANSGCGPTTLSSVYIGLTGDSSKNPYEMAKFAGEGGWFYDSGSARELMTEGARELGLKSDFIDLDEKSVKKALDGDSVVVVLVYEGDFTSSGHFIVLQSYDENGVYLFDVNSYENTNKQWDLKRILDQSAVAWEISK